MPRRLSIPKPSRFAIISLLILLALAQAANLVIAHYDIEGELLIPRKTGWFPTANPSPSDPVRWPKIPDQVLEFLGPPTSASSTSYRLSRSVTIEWNDDQLPRPLHSRLYMQEFGYPLPVHSTKGVYLKFTTLQHITQGNSMIWPVLGGTEEDAATTYHPIGLILNPIIYAIPVWFLFSLMFFLLSRLLRRFNRNHRLSLGLCPYCAYQVNDLPTCPECGTPITPT
tara:strand:+ start:212586 stop:213263 length:678 start_codon:yes stop_codon:yes gene_type:complete